MDNLFHQPQGGNEMPRFAGRATMMRLPFIEDLQGLDAAFVGIPLDIGTSQRSGTRYGPRYIRAESVMIRPYNMATGAAPFDSLSVAEVVQIGQRAQGYAAGDFQWGVDQGFRLVQAEQCWHTSLAPLMAEVRQQMGDGPVYLSFDIDSLDPIWAPGTGTPEVGGLTSIQALEIVRGCRGLNLIGADLVEVSPPYDVSGNTSQLAANLLYEMLCVLPGVKYA
ncbi:MAG: arginase family protein [Klebsiella pneumoniae]|nr:arginase family protein [Klebsiella pneumoniae]